MRQLLFTILFTAATLLPDRTVAVAAQTKVKVDVTGKWAFQVTTTAGGGTPTVTFKQSGETLTGRYSSTNLGEADLTGTVKGQDIEQELTIDFESAVRGTTLQLRSSDGETVMLTGTYQLEGEISGRLLRALPPLLVLAGDAWDTPLIGLLADEIVKDQPGQEAVLDRLLDLLLIAVLRTWFARPEAEAPGWYRAYADPIVGPALKALHEDPAHQWTVEELARGAGVSRAALARRFNDLVGEPPMAFLTGWRIALAADLLLEPDATVGSVAAKVGYGSPFALSTAFKRLRGMSPKQYRVAAMA